MTQARGGAWYLDSVAKQAQPVKVVKKTTKSKLHELPGNEFQTKICIAIIFSAARNAAPKL